MLGAIFETTRMTRNLLILHEADVCDYHALHSSMRVNHHCWEHIPVRLVS